MNTNINTSLLKTFILEKVGDTLNADEAQKLKITDEYENIAEELDQTEIHFEDIVQDEDIYEQFATLYIEEKEQKAAAKDKEAEKEEQNKVQDKNQAGV